MPFNLLLLPLLGGYIVANFGNLSKFIVLRSDGHRLLFYSSLAGVGLLIIATILHALLVDIVLALEAEWLCDGWHRMVPFSYSGIALLSLLLAFPLVLLFNYAIDESQAVDRAIVRKGDPFELLLRRAFGETKMIAITIRNGKVYVGYIRTMFNPALSIESLGIIPQVSGYRDATTKKYIFTTNYIATYDRIRAAASEHLAMSDASGTVAEEEWRRREVENGLGLPDFELVIPVREIESATIFDPDVYLEHFA